MNYFPILLFILIFATGQILPRYYFEAFLLLAYFYNSRGNRLVSFVHYTQYFFVIIACSIFIYLSYVQLNVVFNKNNFMKNFSYGYSNFNKYSKYLSFGNIFVRSDGRGSIFSKNGIYHRNYLEIQNLNLSNSEEFKSFLNDNKINVYISKDDKFIPRCINYNLVDQITTIDSRRNFLVKKKYVFNVYKIDRSQC